MKSTTHLFAAVALVTAACARNDGRTPTGPAAINSAQESGGVSSSGVGAISFREYENDLGLEPSAAMSFASNTMSLAPGDVKNGPLNIDRVRVRPSTGPGFYAEPGGAYRVDPGATNEFWVEWSSDRAVADAPKLVIDWGSPLGADNIHCGPCRLEKTFQAGIRTITVKLDDRAGGVTSRTFVIDARFQAAACTPLPTEVIQGSLSASGPLQDGRLFRDGIPSTCGGKAFPGISSVGNSMAYRTFTFRNGLGAPACITVNHNAGSCAPGFQNFFSAYADSYNPANMASGYLGDAGSSFLGSSSFSFSAPANRDFVIVVTNVQAGGPVSCDFSFSLVGTVCN